jgi:hypothetical protein
MTFKKTFVTVALGFKALALAAAVMMYAGSLSAQADEDCWPCIPPPDCGDHCFDEES